MTKLCNTCEYLRYCARSGIEEVGCDRYQKDTTTNKEWMQTATTEQLAEFLIASIKKCKSCASGIGADEVAHCPFGECGCHFKDEVIKWLKQPHSEVGK